MLESELIQYGIFGILGLSIGVIAYVAIYPLISGEQKTDKRIKTIAARGVIRGEKTRSSDAQNKRRQVQETLKELEESQKKKKKQKLTLRAQLEQAGLSMSPRNFHIVSAITGLLAGAGTSLAGSPMIVVLGAVIAMGFGLPRWVLSFMRKRRFKKFLNEFPNAIDIVVRGVKSGLPFGDTVRIIASESKEPVRGEFREVVEGQAVGMPIGEGLMRMHSRVPLPEVNFLAIVITIQQSSGGNLADALGNLSRVLRGRKMLQSKIVTMSQEAKSSAAIIAALPFGVMGLVYMSTPDYIALLWEEELGQLMLLGSAIWMTLGVLVMRKMINFDY